MLNEVLLHLEGLKPKIKQWARDAVLENKELIINVVKNRQLSQGMNSKGGLLEWHGGTGFYGSSTQSYASSQGARKLKTEGTLYNFEWSGRTFDNMYLKTIREAYSSYEIDSTTGMEEIYGEIFDLTPEHNIWVNKNIIEPYVFQKIIENLFGF